MKYQAQIRKAVLALCLICTCCIASAQSTSESFKVVIDPGHGGRDSVTRAGNILEKNLVLDISLAIKEQLQKNGIEVVLTRETDEFLSLSSRAAIPGDIFVSIHANAVADSIGPSVRSMIKGMEIYTSVSENLVKSTLLATAFKSHFSSLPGLSFRGIKRKKLAVLNRDSPSILIELGFLSNEEDLAFLVNRSNHQQIAGAFIRAVKEYRKVIGLK